MLAAAFSRRHTRNHLRPVFERLLRVEGAGVASHPLRDDLGVFVYEDAHERDFLFDFSEGLGRRRPNKNATIPAEI
jgi:hypothetical protein